MRDRSLVIVLTVLALGGCSVEEQIRQNLPRKAAMPVPPQPAHTVDPSTTVEASAALLARGAELYSANCAACHGLQGQGDGEAQYLLYPKPRDLRKGRYRFVSTWEGIPTGEDLFRTLSRGIPGSAMPSWAHWPETDRWAVVHHIRSFSELPLDVPEQVVADPASGQNGEGLIAVPPEPPLDAASLARGAELFQQQCVRCHGERGEGDGPSAATLSDDTGLPIRPRNLRSGVYKGDPRPEHLFRRIAGGIPGTPMPTASVRDMIDIWHLVHYVLSLSSETLRNRAEMRRLQLFVPRVESLPDHPDSGEWISAPPVALHLMPLWWRYNRPEYVTVQALHDGREIALLLEWADETRDETAIRPQDFRDAAAVEFALDGTEPFFAMGQRDAAVNIWMWKSERQADLTRFQDIEAQYPNAGIDSYPNLQRAPYEQPMRQALTLESDPTFITAWGAGNIVADPTRKSAAEDLSAEGFGTLRARPASDQQVRATGVYGMGSYRVLFRRSLAPSGKNSARLEPGSRVPVAFAIWNGSAGDRDGKKSVSIWQDLVLLP